MTTKPNVKCTECERTFKSRQAMSLHRTRTHSRTQRAAVSIGGTSQNGDLTITVEIQGVKIKASSIEELDAKVKEALSPLIALKAYLKAGQG